jgi:hypothetical protein
LDEPVWDVTVFTKNRNRLLEGDVAREFLGEVVVQAQAQGLTSDEHFTGVWDADRSVGESKEFSAQGQEEPTTSGRSGKPDGRLSRRDPQQPNA